MLQLQQVIPDDSFYNTDAPNIKIYEGALPSVLRDILNLNNLDKTRLNVLNKEITPSKLFFLFRHCESTYNIYLKKKEDSDFYKELIATEDDAKKTILAQQLIAEFIDEVGIDYHTPLSDHGQQQAEEYGSLYGKIFSANPGLMPDKILISPYTRTKHTAYALLKNLKGLDMDIDFLLDNKDLVDMRIGSFNNKQIVLSLHDDIRERDFGNNYVPWFIRSILEKMNSGSYLDDISQNKSHYYTSTNGGESQVQVNKRAQQLFHGLTSDNRYNNYMIFTHHLFILAAINNIFAGTFNTFHSLDTYRKPHNGSMTTLAEVLGDNGDKKLRVAGYNLIPTGKLY